MSRGRRNVAAPEAVEELAPPAEEYVPDGLDEMPAAKVVVSVAPKVLRVAPPRSVTTRRGLLAPGSEVLPGDIPAANIEKLIATGRLVLE